MGVNGSLVQGFLYQGQLRPVAELDGNVVGYIRLSFPTSLACNAHVRHYPEVYKTWEGKWPPAFAGPDDKAVLYTDEEPLMP